MTLRASLLFTLPLAFFVGGVGLIGGCGSSDESTFGDPDPDGRGAPGCIQNDKAPVVPPPPVK